MQITIEEINRLLAVDSSSVRALDVIDSVSRETLVKTLTAIITKLEQN